jgi:hypothetical protein
MRSSDFNPSGLTWTSLGKIGAASASNAPKEGETTPSALPAALPDVVSFGQGLLRPLEPGGWPACAYSAASILFFCSHRKHTLQQYIHVSFLIFI